MSDTPTVTDSTESTDTSTQTEETTPPEGGNPLVNQSQADLPEWARQEISDANAEAARYRVEKNQAVEAGKAQVQEQYETKLTQAFEDHQKTKDDLELAKVHITKLTAAINEGIPSEHIVDFAGLLQGVSEEEIGSHAKKVKEIFGKPIGNQPPTDPSQGRGNSKTIPLNGDPILAAIKAAVRA